MNFSAGAHNEILGYEVSSYEDETCGSNRQLSTLGYTAIDTIT
jgi:hypothetical protein